ncbi:MAG: hypothetical protein ABIM89_03380 [Mycobacteriales bacterium]
MNRRDFLRLSGLTTVPIAVPLLASCERKPKPEARPTSPTPSTGSLSASEALAAETRPLSEVVTAKDGQIQIGNAQAETLVGAGRIAVGLRKDNAAITDSIVTVYVGQDADKPPVASARASWVQGEMAAMGLYVADLSIPSAGEWLVGVTARRKDGTVYGGGVTIDVVATSPSPVAGQPAISVVTPTTADPGGADPLCSNSPPCPMHEISLDAALKNGKPTVLTIAAPAYCATETCGPVVRLVSAAMPAYADRYNFVHIEAYDKDDIRTLVPAAAAWKLTSEPFTFFIDAAGIVRDRLPGAFGEVELGNRIAALERP